MPESRMVQQTNRSYRKVDIYLTRYRYETIIRMCTIGVPHEVLEESAFNKFIYEETKFSCITNNSGTDNGGPAHRLLFVLLIPPTCEYADQFSISREEIFNLAQKNRIDLIAPGYDENGSFSWEDFNKFCETFTEESKGTWKRVDDIPELLVINAIDFYHKLLVAANGYFAVNISACISEGWGSNLLGFFLKLISMKDEECKATDFFDKIKNELGLVEIFDRANEVLAGGRPHGYSVRRKILKYGIKAGIGNKIQSLIKVYKSGR